MIVELIISGKEDAIVIIPVLPVREQRHKADKWRDQGRTARKRWSQDLSGEPVLTYRAPSLPASGPRGAGGAHRGKGKRKQTGPAFPSRLGKPAEGLGGPIREFISTGGYRHNLPSLILSWAAVITWREGFLKLTFLKTNHNKNYEESRNKCSKRL